MCVAIICHVICHVTLSVLASISACTSDVMSFVEATQFTVDVIDNQVHVNEFELMIGDVVVTPLTVDVAVFAAVENEFVVSHRI